MPKTIKVLQILGYKFDISETYCKVTFGKQLIFGAGDFDGKGGKLNNSFAENLRLAALKANEHFSAVSGGNHDATKA